LSPSGDRVERFERGRAGNQHDPRRSRAWPDLPGIKAGFRRDYRGLAVAPGSYPAARQVVVWVKVFGLARDAEGVQEPAFDAERFTQCELGVFGDPPPEDRAVFGDQSGLSVILLAVEVGLGPPELQAQLLAEVGDEGGALQIGQPAPGPDYQGSSVDWRRDHDC
jgi:hypothetical protein